MHASGKKPSYSFFAGIVHISSEDGLPRPGDSGRGNLLCCKVVETYTFIEKMQIVWISNIIFFFTCEVIL